MSQNTSFGDVLRLDKPRHIKYWARCLKTLLPSQYTSNDSNRMYLAYFILSALDLLDSLDTLTSAEERSGYISWIYRCQHPKGGFRMWPGTDFGDRSTSENEKWDPANVPATYFALASLLILKDDLKQVKRTETLRWLKSMQRPDGSFGETFVDGRVEGGRDPRFGYCAAGTRFVLRGTTSGPVHSGNEVVEDIEVDALVRCISASESYEGGIADDPYHEPHAGYTFCSLGTLALTGRLGADGSQHTSPINRTATLRWLVERQTDFTDPDGSLDSEFVARLPTIQKTQTDDETKETKPATAAMADELHQSPDKSTLWSSDAMSQVEPTVAGMNGRLNKVADTCYGWWVTASIHILQYGNTFDQPALRRYLLKLTQHPYMGGFCKFPGDKYADLYHSFMGLAALSLSSTEAERRTDGIKEWNAEMCVSVDVKSRLAELWSDFGWV